jgi:hypothetical protein
VHAEGDEKAFEDRPNLATCRTCDDSYHGAHVLILITPYNISALDCYADLGNDGRLHVVYSPDYLT